MRARGEERRVSPCKFVVPLLIKQSATCSWVTHSVETTFNSASAQCCGESFPGFIHRTEGIRLQPLSLHAIIHIYDKLTFSWVDGEKQQVSHFLSLAALQKKKEKIIFNIWYCSLLCHKQRDGTEVNISNIKSFAQHVIIFCFTFH